MAKQRITRKDVGNKVEFSFNDKAFTSMVGTVVKVARGIAKIEYQYIGNTYTHYLDVNSKDILAVHRIVAYSITTEELLKSAQA